MATFLTNPQIYWLTLAGGMLLLPLQALQSAQRPKRAVHQRYEKARAAEADRDFKKAIAHLEAALKKDHSFLPAHLRLIHIYKQLLKEEALIAQLKHMIAAMPQSQQMKPFYLQLAQKLAAQGQYKAAQQYLNSYFQLYTSATPEAHHLSACLQYAEKAMTAAPSLSPTHLPATINAFPQQYFPSLSLDGTHMLFTARHSLNYEADEDLYLSLLDPHTKTWQSPTPLPQHINSPENEGTATLSSDGETLIFTACQRPDALGSCDLYMSHYSQGQWQPAAPMPAPINTPYWESQPALSADGRKLYFASNRPGGEGGRDLWYSTQNSKGFWQLPHNLGPIINTFKDELSPFLHANGASLYFSSNGHVGLGGFDIFLSEEKDGNWQPPRNLGYPLNDHHDQVSFVVSYRGDLAYYAHEEETQVGQKYSYLYQVQLPVSAQISHPVALLQGTVRDAQTQTPLQATLKLFVLGQSQSTYQLQSHPKTGTYTLALPEGKQYLLYAEAPGYLLQSKSLASEQKASQILDIYLDPLQAGSSYTLENIYFALDSYALDSLSITELRELVSFLQENPALGIEIAGHTDDQGSSAYNYQLSLRRAQAVYTFLVQAGISAQRLRYLGYGETQPRFSNTNETQRARNRRIEMRILK